METIDPADVLSRLDAKIQFFEPGAMATVAYGVIDPQMRTLTISTAGHLPPVVLDDSGFHCLPVPADPPVGAFPDVVRRATAVVLPDAMLFYTDGLVERRGRPLSGSIAALVARLRAGSAEDVCGDATATLQDDPVTDDVAVMVIRPRPGRLA
jgi:serine phosphatase RsbU (regulator of sigma subunit)